MTTPKTTITAGARPEAAQDKPVYFVSNRFMGDITLANGQTLNLGRSYLTSDYQDHWPTVGLNSRQLEATKAKLTALLIQYPEARGKVAIWRAPFMQHPEWDLVMDEQECAALQPEASR